VDSVAAVDLAAGTMFKLGVAMEFATPAWVGAKCLHH
jgi:hypothetical protein